MLEYIEIGSNLNRGIDGLRQPTYLSDVDFICTEDYYNGLREELLDFDYYTEHDGNHPIRKSFYFKHKDKPAIEVEVATKGSCAEKLLKLLYDNVPYRNIDLAYTLKMSHRYLRNSPHFEKTHSDINDLRKVGAVIPEFLKDWLAEREAETYYYKHPNLNQRKNEFFDTPNVTYIYDHDSIHTVVAVDDKPAYSNFLVGEVKTCRKLFESLPLSIRLNAVLEEAAVLAIERSLVNTPNPSRNDIDSVWVYSLQKVCTSITSGWFREFAWENYSLCKKLYYSRMSDYYDRFLAGVESGKVIKL